MRENRKFLVFLVLGGSAFILSRGLIDMFLIRGDTLTSGNPVTRLIFTLSYLSVAMVLVPYARKALFVARRNWFVVALVLMAFASCLWTDAPALVFRRSIAVLGTTLLGIALATRLSLDDQLRVMSWVFRILAVLSLGCVLIFPSSGISQTVETLGAWQGVFGYKNALGAMMAVCILVEWHRPADTGYSKLLKWFTVLIAAFLLVFSNSVTPLLTLCACLLFIEIYRFAKQRLRLPLYAIVLTMLLVVASGITVLFLDSAILTGSLGRESNFTGRTAIWSIVLSDISERPILGYGYSGFWYGSSTESAAVDQALATPIMYSHNGYLESLLNLGAVGFLFTLLFLGFGVVRAYYCFERDRSRVNLWPLAYLAFFLLYNIGECTILIQEVQWALCVAVVASSDAALLLPVTEPERGEEMLYVPIDEPA